RFDRNVPPETHPLLVSQSPCVEELQLANPRKRPRTRRRVTDSHRTWVRRTRFFLDPRGKSSFKVSQA
ncbi:unnamed protein product, partial [Ectocarpus sp. 12 AP-2014]